MLMSRSEFASAETAVLAGLSLALGQTGGYELVHFQPTETPETCSCLRHLAQGYSVSPEKPLGPPWFVCEMRKQLQKAGLNPEYFLRAVRWWEKISIRTLAITPTGFALEVDTYPHYCPSPGYVFLLLLDNDLGKHPGLTIHGRSPLSSPQEATFDPTTAQIITAQTNSQNFFIVKDPEKVVIIDDAGETRFYRAQSPVISLAKRSILPTTNANVHTNGASDLLPVTR